MEHLGDRDAVPLVDDTGFPKKGVRSAGVRRQHSGTAGRTGNRRIGVFLAHAAPRGRTLIDRRLYLPTWWTDDRERCPGSRARSGSTTRAAREPTACGSSTGPGSRYGPCILRIAALDDRPPKRQPSAGDLLPRHPLPRRDPWAN
ncbi:transposase [Streptomyces mirabilis]|uniref:transposase n=1 Tax=Streptomyces mirabilis TaxID=68239 RepID=UPI0038178CEB